MLKLLMQYRQLIDVRHCFNISMNLSKRLNIIDRILPIEIWNTKWREFYIIPGSFYKYLKLSTLSLIAGIKIDPGSFVHHLMAYSVI